MPDLRYALGRQPADPTKPKLRLRRSAVERPTPPASCDWLAPVPGWHMFRNDEIGCCTCASMAHVAIEVDKNGQQRDLTITDDEVLAAYRAVSGYDPADPSTDVGATLQDALGHWHKTGIADNKIAAFAWVDAHDLDLVRACVATFGAVYTGFWVTAAAMDQFDRGKPWTYTGRSANLGGHCVPIGAYTPDSFTCVTWGRTQKMSLAFYQRYFDEVVVPIDLDWMRANGTSPAGLDVAALNADYEALTGQPGPFPPAVPEPAPLPPYGPTVDADTDLVAAFEAWRAARGI